MSSSHVVLDQVDIAIDDEHAVAGRAAAAGDLGGAAGEPGLR
jgi:hypothetical protein